MHAQTISTTTPGKANEATPPAALKTKRAALRAVLPGETPVQAAIRATEAQREVMAAAYATYEAAEAARAERERALEAVSFPAELVVTVPPRITDEHHTWPIEMVFRHPDGREVSKPIGASRPERLESREAIVAHFGEEHPDLQERLGAFDRWQAETAPLRQALEKAQKVEEKADRAWQRSYQLNDKLCCAILEAPAEPHEASQQADAYLRLLASSNGRDVPKRIMFGEEADPLLVFLRGGLKRPDPAPPSPMLDALSERNRIVDYLNAGSDLSDEEFDRQHDLGWKLNHQVLDDDSLTPDSVLAKLRLILRADVVEALQFDEATVLKAFRSSIALLEAMFPTLRRQDALLEAADRANAWIDDFLGAGGSIARQHRDDGPDLIGFHQITHGIPIPKRALASALLHELEDLPEDFAKEVKRIAFDRMVVKGTDLLPSPALTAHLTIAAE